MKASESSELPGRGRVLLTAWEMITAAALFESRDGRRVINDPPCNVREGGEERSRDPSDLSEEMEGTGGGRGKLTHYSDGAAASAIAMRATSRKKFVSFSLFFAFIFA